ncbi:hypothetical protein A2U01_0075890, partial [Trifolium medium]|nr:hypothetical protein [Trifolium medium]
AHPGPSARRRYQAEVASQALKGEVPSRYRGKEDREVSPCHSRLGNEEESCCAEEASGYGFLGFHAACGSTTRRASPSASVLGGTDAAARAAQSIS